MAFNPTTNRVAFRLLRQHERIALTRWPHGWEWFCPFEGGWTETKEPEWLATLVYRGKPAPANKED